MCQWEFFLTPPKACKIIIPSLLTPWSQLTDDFPNISQENYKWLPAGRKWQHICATCLYFIYQESPRLTRLMSSSSALICCKTDSLSRQQSTRDTRQTLSRTDASPTGPFYLAKHRKIKFQIEELFAICKYALSNKLSFSRLTLQNVLQFFKNRFSHCKIFSVR